FEARDGTNVTTRTVKVTVLNVNGPISFVPLDTLITSEGQLFNVRIIAIDPNVAPAGADVGSSGGTLTYSVSGLPEGATYDVATNTLSWMPTFAQAGTYQIRFTATNDGDGTGTPTQAEQIVTIEVRDMNATPVVDPVPNQIVAVGDTLDIALSASDADETSLAFSIVGLPDFATLIDHGDGTATLHVAPVPGQRGNYTLTVRATDTGNGVPAAALTGTYTFVLAVTAANEPPVLAPVGDKVAVVGETLTFTVRVSDPDEDLLTWAADDLPDGAVFVGGSIYGTATFTWTPGEAAIGTHEITLRVTDSGNG